MYSNLLIITNTPRNCGAEYVFQVVQLNCLKNWVVGCWMNILLSIHSSLFAMYLLNTGMSLN